MFSGTDGTAKGFTLVFFLSWMTYAVLYMVRKVPSTVKASLGLEPAELGWLDLVFLFAYTAGQFAVGPVTDMYGGEIIISITLIGTGVCALYTSYAASMFDFTLMAFGHGLFQGFGYPSCMKVLAMWPMGNKRGTYMGWWSTNQSVGGLLGVAMAAYITEIWGWRNAFQVPAVLSILMGIICLVGFRMAPAPEYAPAATDEIQAEDTERPGLLAGIYHGIVDILSLPGVVQVGMTYFFVKFLRYVLMFWLPYYNSQALGYDIATAGYMATAYEFGAIFGPIVLGYVSDTWTNQRRILPCGIMILLTALTLAIFHDSSNNNHRYFTDSRRWWRTITKSKWSQYGN